VLDGDPAPPKRGTALRFRPMSIVAKRSPISATAEHLLHDLTLRCFSRTLNCDRQTDRQTDRDTTTAYTALAWRLAVKIQVV